MTYSYTPLQDPNRIRLLHLEPGCGSNPLKARLATHQLGDQCSYEALSYVWGEPDLTEVLLIDNQGFRISTNLHAIILHLRHPDEIRVLWIDAICINQQDGIEKGQQIAIMGQIFQQADAVLCWLGELSTHRLWALKFLQALAEEAPQYLQPCEEEHFWTFIKDKLVPGVDPSLVVEAASKAHVEAVYEAEWFTRLWVVQELALATNPRVLCGTYDLCWKDFEIATRVIASCLRKFSHPPKSLSLMNEAIGLMELRARYCLNMRPVTARPFIFHVDHPWSIGRLALDMMKKKCKDDKDRVYALLNLTSSGYNFRSHSPEIFTPNYDQTVEWAYHQFWSRFGGYTFLYYGGLSRRRGHRKIDKNPAAEEDIFAYFKDSYLPSWVPDLRPHANEWSPIFGFDYGTSTPLHHMNADFTTGVNMIRGHRFDVVVRGFHIDQQIQSCGKLEDLVYLRNTINFFLSLRSEYEPYPSGQAWIEALGSTLMMDMPYEYGHPFQKCLDTHKIKTALSNNELRRIWQLYLDLILANTGSVWTKFRSITLSRKVSKFDPFVELDHDGQLAWLLHQYLGKVLQVHRLIITERGYMGLAPPDATVGDVVVAIGGPGVPFVVRDISACVIGGLAADGVSGIGRLVTDRKKRNLSQLLGPCYLQGIMKGELHKEERYKTNFEWETDKFGTIPKPTLCLI